MPIIVPIPRGERRLMQKAIHKTRDKNHARRLTAMLMLHRGERVSDVARTLCCARSSVGRWINWFTHSGIEGLKSLPAGRSRRCPSDVEHRQIKYRNNVIECDHGKLKR
ncbi:helix-turn-helix domain-containing protein, partial [Escherichia coli]